MSSNNVNIHTIHQINLNERNQIHHDINSSTNVENTKTENRQIYNNDTNINVPKQKMSTFLKIIIIISISAISVTAIIVPIVVLTNKKDDDNNNTNDINKKEQTISTTITDISKIYIEELRRTKYCIYSTLELNCINLINYPEIQLNDISFEFPVEDSTVKYNADSINENIIEKKIPPEVMAK